MKKQYTSYSSRPGSHGCKNFASALQRPLPLKLKILQHGHTHIFIDAPPARRSKVRKLSKECILLFCLSLFSFVSKFFFTLLLSLTHAHGSLSLSLSLFWSLPLSLSFSISLSLSLSLSLSTLYHILFVTTHGLSRYLLPQSHRRLFSPTKKKKKKKHASLIENVFLRRECSLFQKKKKRKEKNNRNCMTSHSFSYCEHCSQHFSSAVAAREAAPSYLDPQNYCLSSPTE